MVRMCLLQACRPDAGSRTRRGAAAADRCIRRGCVACPALCHIGVNSLRLLRHRQALIVPQHGAIAGGDPLRQRGEGFPAREMRGDLRRIPVALPVAADDGNLGQPEAREMRETSGRSTPWPAVVVVRGLIGRGRPIAGDHVAFRDVGTAGAACAGRGWCRWLQDNRLGCVDQRLALAVPEGQVCGWQRDYLVEIGEAQVRVEFEGFCQSAVSICA
ncbi:hypothetical protein D3C71_1615720 [compost metagenome]